MSTLPAAGDDWRAWSAIAERLGARDRVHRPSAFSALLASTMSDTAGRVVLDAGCGSGLITVAALSYGAERVVAYDLDPAALASTLENVREVLGADAVSRVEPVAGDFAALGGVAADLLAVNPPQRPARLLPDVEPDQRHLHEGGGEDGLATHRLVLANAATAVVRTTAAAVLPLADLAPTLDQHGWSGPVLVASAELPMHPAWHRLTTPVSRVDVWDVHRSPGG